MVPALRKNGKRGDDTVSSTETDEVRYDNTKSSSDSGGTTTLQYY